MTDARQWICVVVLVVVLPMSALGQQRQGESPTTAFDTLALDAPGVAMHALLEKTIFRVDVLTLDIRFGPEASQALAALRLRSADVPALHDSIAAVAIGATEVVARIRFLRSVSQGQFLGGIRDNLKKAREAGIVDAETSALIEDGLPVWYAFLRDRGIADGDEMWYEIRGDTLRTMYRTPGRQVLLDQVDVGAHTRLSVLGGYFAPGSDFRRSLIRSFLDRER